MIKLIIFDLDGVLCTTRELHYESLNAALAEIDTKYVISREEHLAKYDGLSTTKKLAILTAEKGLPKEYHTKVWALKQEKTTELINKFPSDPFKTALFRILKNNGYKIAVASNSIRDTVRILLSKIGMLEYVDYFYSNEDVKFPKPSSEMYLKAMIAAGVSPKETIIIEDSHIGRQAALNSGAHLLAVKDPSEVTYDKIWRFVESLSENKKPKWQGGSMNIVIPMAGAGSRFEKVGYTFPKPLIEVHGKPMIQIVTENLNVDANFIFIVRKEHYEKYSLKHLLNLLAPKCTIIQIDHITEGAACTVLLAKEHINNDNPLLIINSDQYLEWDANEFMYSMQGDTIDGGMATFISTHPKWSFAKLDDNGYVKETAEKTPISDNATCGVYYWTHGKDFVNCAEEMIEKNIRVNNEFYVCPVYNMGISHGMKFKIYPVKKMWSLGTPEDLNLFLSEHKERI